MKRSASHRAMLGLLVAGGLAGAGLIVASLAATHPRTSVDRPPPPGTSTVSATVGSRPYGQLLPAGFVGFSLEYTALEPYAGSARTGPNPVLVQLIRNLTPGQRPVVRIGGNSADLTWWPQPGEPAPRHAEFALTASWLRATEALASALDARLVMDVNLKGGRADVAAGEALAFERWLAPGYLAALEIGNEPDLYPLFPWYREGGHEVYGRPASYGLSDYVREFSRWRSTIGHRVPVAGPAFATFDWSLGQFIAAEPGLGLVTFHHYPLDACLAKSSARGYPTIASLLADQASSGFARVIARGVAAAHAARLPFRLDELNSAECSGKRGVSDTFASALWMLDTLFNLAEIGVDGVNIHTFPGAAYAPFSPSHTPRGWQASVAPAYYGLLMFTRAFPRGARLLPVISPAGPLKVWASDGPGSRTRVLLINKNQTSAYVVRLRVPSLKGTAHLERLRAPTGASTTGLTLGGQTFGASTATGRLPAPRGELLAPRRGVYPVTVPADSAALLSS